MVVRWEVVIRAALMFVLCLNLLACGVPQHMEVRNGLDPSRQDEDVRFRTTYYFRVFDECQLDRDKFNPSDFERSDTLPFLTRVRGGNRLLKDSLYRFRMTGQANSLFSSVHFESGTLKASEIEPFGAEVRYDDSSRRYRFESRSDSDARLRREDIYREIDRLKSMSQGAAKTSIDAKVSERVNALFTELNRLSGAPQSGQGPKDEKNAKNGGSGSDGGSGSANGGNQCPQGFVAKRGFQILGPEGFREFDQSERLVMAMSISGQPLISAMRELSGRALTEQVDPSAGLLDIAGENVRTLHAQRTLERIVSPKSPDDLKAVLESFQPEGNK